MRLRVALVAVALLAVVSACGGSAASPSQSASASLPAASLALPTLAPPTIEPTPTPTAAPGTASGTTYRVKKGDSLSAIAERYKVTLKALEARKPTDQEPRRPQDRPDPGDPRAVTRARPGRTVS